MGAKRNRRELGAAWAADELALARRSLWKAEVLEGFVVDLSHEWVALNVVWDVGLNGWSIVRLDTIREVTRTRSDSFLPRALAWYDHHASPLPIELGTCHDLIAALATDFPLLTLFTEAEDPTMCAIGRPVRLTNTKVHLLGISSDAEWADEPQRLRLEDITRIDVGGSYERALHDLGGYPPIPGCKPA